MQIPLVEFMPWDKSLAINRNNLNLKLGDVVIVNTDYGAEAGKIVGFEHVADGEELTTAGDANSREIERFANRDDLDSIKYNQSRRDESLRYCKTLAKKHGLDMKLVDCHLSFDDKRIVFAFIADGRVDFRELVKDLSRHFQKVIRLHQMGVRDEAKFFGDVGCCGQTQCCISHLQKIGNVNSEFADDQQVVHRGSERLSGVCGRLKCCLAYEEEHYQELIKQLPPVGTRVKTKHGRGEVVGWHVLKGSVMVKIDTEKDNEKNIIVEVPVIKNKEAEPPVEK
ncbi:MAG: regulatory iron-sulfur-containing complex subunit RicT [Patescibacteria group bacterium]